MKIILKIKFIIAFVSVLATTLTFGQQNSLFNNYSLDLLQINIAQAGLKCTEANLNYRNQWVGVQNAPSAFQLNAQTALGKSNGLGIRVNSQAQGLFNNLSTTLGYSYRIKLNAANVISLGIGAGWTQNTFNAQKAVVVDLNDANLTANRQIANGFDIEFGAMFKGKKLQIGVSALHLYNTNQRFSNTSGYKLLPQLNTVIGYVFNQGKKIEIEPWMLNRFTLKGNNITEGILNVHYKRTLTVGAGFRSNYSVLSLIAVQLRNVKIAYGFDAGVTKRALNLGTSHQISLGISFCKKEPLKELIIEKLVEIEKPQELIVEDVPDTILQIVQPEIIEVKKLDSIIKPIQIEKTNQELLKEINKVAEEVQFDLNSATLSSNQLNSIDEIASFLKQHPSLKVIILGYTCNLGSEETNAKLALQRAKYIQNLLISKGVNSTQINQSRGVDFEKALFDNSGKYMTKNRTIRFEL